MKFTILGASGFIGSRLTAHLKAAGIDCYCPGRGDVSIQSDHLGHVVDCVGLTADFRKRRFATVEAHVDFPARILEKGSFDSFLLLSSTRVYLGAGRGDEETELVVRPDKLDYLYNLSKLMGESLCLTDSNPCVRVVRLSNVYGDDPTSENFLMSLLREAVDTGRIVLRSSLGSGKDYISVADVVKMLLQIAVQGKQRLYNLAAGENVSHGALVEAIQHITGCALEVEDGAPEVIFPRIDTARIRAEFDFRPERLIDALPSLVASYSAALRTS